MLNCKKTLVETLIQTIIFLLRDLDIVQRRCCANEELVSLQHWDILLVVEDFSESFSPNGHDAVLQMSSKIWGKGEATYWTDLVHIEFESILRSSPEVASYEIVSLCKEPPSVHDLQSSKILDVRVFRVRRNHWQRYNENSYDSNCGEEYVWRNLLPSYSKKFSGHSQIIGRRHGRGRLRGALAAGKWYLQMSAFYTCYNVVREENRALSR